MADFALVALDGAYHSSVGALLDSYVLARDRIENVFSGSEPMAMETRLRVLSVDGRAVAMSDGRTLEVDGAIAPGETFAFVWLPAFRAGGQKEFEHRIATSQPLIDWLRDQSNEGAVIAGSGASALLLAAAKLTDGLPVPIARALQPLARTMFPRLRQEERLGLVDYGNLLIANGVSSDLALIVRVMQRTIAPEVSRWLTSIFGLDREEEELLAIDPLVARAQIWLEQRFTGSVGIGDLAVALSTSHPTLIRRFHKALGMTPRDYVQQLRLLAAQRMLDKSSRSIDRIAELVGYSDSRLFRTMFRDRTGMTASEWRRRNRKAG
ncbi:MAG: transcriptional regulator [Alphaproteobacteria bacterium]|nr:transcriptional regulator [Alphaproteobacteria bacterium]